MIDFACVSSTTPTWSNDPRWRTPGIAATEAEQGKLAADRASSAPAVQSVHRYYPFVVENCGRLGKSALTVVYIFAVMLAVRNFHGGQPPSQLNLCLEFGHKEAGFYLAPSLLAAYTLAGEHIEMRNCSLVPDCEALLSPPGGGGGDGGTSPASTAFTSVRFRTWRAQEYHSAVHSAVAALECNTWGGDLYLLDQNSLADTLVPINTANRLVTAAAVLGGGDHALNLDGDHRASFLRTHFSPLLEADNIVSLASYFGWNRVTVLYSPSAVDFVAAVQSAGARLGVEVGTFSLGSDFPSKINSVLDFGSSIIILPTPVRDDNPEMMDKALSLCKENGLFGPKYTWIATHHASRVHVDELYIPDDTEIGSLLQSMLFHRITTGVLPSTAKLWDMAKSSNTVKGAVEDVFGDMDLEEDWVAVAENQYPTDAAVAYDTVWLAAAAIAKCAEKNVTAAAAPLSFAVSGDYVDGTWLQCVEDVGHFEGASGNFAEGQGSYRTTSGTVFYGELFQVIVKEYDSEHNHHHYLHKSLANFHANNDSIEFAKGQTSLPWRDGSSYPSSVPFADIRESESNSNKDALYGAIGAMLVMLVLLLLVCASYGALRKELNTIAVMKLDTDSPLVKAVQLLQEVSRRTILTRAMRERALRTAMSLSHAENVHAPDLAAQADSGNKDIMTYLLFKNNANSTISKSRPPSRTEPKAHTSSGEIEQLREGDRGPDAISETADAALTKEICALVPKEQLSLVERAGEDLFFHTELMSKHCSEPLLTASLQVIKHRLLAETHDLDVPKLVNYIRFIEAGYMDVPYHNAVHAADVMLRLCAILTHDHLFTDPDNHNDSFLLLCAVLAAVVHDYQHPGLNNSFQVATDSGISREFNEQMVLENLSLSRALHALRESEEKNFMHRWSKSKQQRLCSTVIQLVLATDMSRHFDLMSSFQGKIVPLGSSHTSSAKMIKNSRVSVPSMFGSSLNIATTADGSVHAPTNGSDTAQNIGTKRRTSGQHFDKMLFRGGRRGSALSGPSVTDTSLTQITSGFGPNLGGPQEESIVEKMDPKMKILLLQMAIKIADIGHMTTHFDIHYKWSQRLEDEFFEQGDKERTLGLEISPLMNREKPGVMDANNQKTFCNIIVMPMLEAWQAIAPHSARRLLKEAHNNRMKWEKGLRTDIIIE
eukprot:jgi/Tetstr1/463444/TSEL_008337.t1